MAEFDAWASLYDLVHSGLPGETELYIDLASKCEGAVLELGVGTGRVAIPTVQKGIPVVGLDISEAMLDECARKWAKVSTQENTQQLTLIQGDMSNFDLGKQFSLITMPYRSFMHLLTSEQQKNCLKSVALHLSPGGQFIMNTWVPDSACIYAFGSAQDELEYRHIDTYTLEDEGSIEHFHSVSYCDFDQRMQEQHLLVRKDINGQEVAEEKLPLVRTWFFIREMKNLIESSPLKLESVWGSFERTLLKAGDTEAIWVLKV